MSWFLPASCALLLVTACNPPDVTTARDRDRWTTVTPYSGGPLVAPPSGTGGAASAPPGGTGGAGWAGGSGVAGGGAGSGAEAGAGAGSGEFPTAGNDAAGGGGGGVPAPMFNPGTDPNRNMVVPGMICERLATIQCAGEEFCCINPGRNVETCKQAYRTSCDRDALADDVAAEPVTAFDAERAFVVFTELERLASECRPEISAYAESVEGLRTIFAGTVGAGGDCRPANPLSKVQAGAGLAACTGHETHACMPSLGAWRCDPHVGAGGHCFSDVNCTQGLYCNNPNFDVAGADCLQRKAERSACQYDNECQSLFCRAGACVAADVQTAYCPAP